MGAYPRAETIDGYGCVLGHGDEARTGRLQVLFEPIIRQGRPASTWGFGEPDRFSYFIVTVFLDGVMLAGERDITVSVTTAPWATDAKPAAGLTAYHFPRLVWDSAMHEYRSEPADPDKNHLFVLPLGEGV